jgi:hypothetical protein
MWCCGDVRDIPDISKDSSVFIFNGHGVQDLFPVLPNPWKLRNYVPLKHVELLIQHSITFQTTCILSNTTARTSKFACCNWLDGLWVTLKWDVTAVKVRRKQTRFYVTTTLCNLVQWQPQHCKSLKRGRQKLPAISHSVVSPARPDVFLVSHRVHSLNFKLANSKFGTKELEQWWYETLPGGKVRPVCDADPSPPSSAKVKYRVELYLYSP